MNKRCAYQQRMSDVFSVFPGKAGLVCALLCMICIFAVQEVSAQSRIVEDRSYDIQVQRLKESNKTLKLYSSFRKEAARPYIAILEDPRGDFDAKNVEAMYHAGQITPSGSGSARETITFGLSGTPAWLVMGMHNSDRNAAEFIFSMTGGHYQTQGLIKEMQVYELHGRSGNIREVQEPYFSFSVAPDEYVLLMVYVEPAGHWPVTMRPYIFTPEEYVKALEPRSSAVVPAVYLLFGIGLAAIIVIALQNKKVAVFVISFILFIIMVSLASHPHIVSALLSKMTYSYLYTGIILSAAVGLILQNGIRLTDKNEMISIGVPVCLTVIANILAHFIPEGFGLLNVLFIAVAPLLLCLSLIVVTLVFYQLERSSSLWWAMWMWVSFMLSLIFFLLNGADFYLSFGFFPVWLPYMFMMLAMIAMVIYAVSNEELFLSDLSSGFTKITTTIRGLRAAEDAGEYNRLLMVVKRERQIMAELREKDMRRRKEMQKAKESADEANRAKSAFLAVISHEIRTPMSGVMGLVRLLTNTSLTEEQQKYARTILDSGESMTTLLNDILDFEKIESGRMVLEDVDFELDQVIHSAAMLMAGHAKNKDIKLIVSVEGSIPSVFIGDPSRLRQVILNLVGNAIKFTETGGVYITVTRNHNVNKEDDDPSIPLSIAVRDTGIGIPQDALMNLFDPFAQADKSTSRLYGGSGLGLAICKRLIEAMGGTITVESQVGEGSIFRINFSLPLAEPTGKPLEYQRSKTPVDYTEIFDQDNRGSGDEATEGQAGEGSGGQEVSDFGSVETDAVNDIFQLQAEEGIDILVIEDNEINQQVMVDFLKPYTKELGQSLDAEDGLDKCRNKKYDLIFMDWELPGMNGPDAIRELRKDESFPSHTTPAVLLTGHNVSLAETGLSPDEVSAVLTKPISPEQLRDIIFSIHPDLKQQMRRKVIQQKQQQQAQQKRPDKPHQAPATEEASEYTSPLVQRDEEGIAPPPPPTQSAPAAQPQTPTSPPPPVEASVASGMEEGEESQVYEPVATPAPSPASAPESRGFAQVPDEMPELAIDEGEDMQETGEGEGGSGFSPPSPSVRQQEDMTAHITDSPSFELADEETMADERSEETLHVSGEDISYTEDAGDLSLSPFYVSDASSGIPSEGQSGAEADEGGAQAGGETMNGAEVEWPDTIFNQAMLTSLLDTLGKEKVLELMDSVVVKADEILVDMRQALADEDIRLIMMRAHELKGMSGNFAMGEIQRISETIEKAVKSGVGNYDEHLASLDRALDDVKKFMGAAGRG